MEGPYTPCCLQKKSLLSELRSGPRSNGLGPAKIVIGWGVSGVGFRAWGLQGFKIQDLRNMFLSILKTPYFRGHPQQEGPPDCAQMIQALYLAVKEPYISPRFMSSRVHGFRVLGLGGLVLPGLGAGDKGAGLRATCLEFRMCRVQDLGFRVWALGFRI